MRRKDFWLMVALAFAAALLGGTISTQLGSDNPTEKVIEAGTIHLYDTDGHIRATLVLGVHGEPGLAMYDEEQQPRMTLGLDTHGEPSLKFLDENSEIIWSAP